MNQKSRLLGADVPLDITDKDTMVLVVCAISKVENGTPAVINEVLDEMRSIRCVEHTGKAKHITPVSYTHLTLPTKHPV